MSVDWVAPTAGIAIAVDSANNAYTVNYVYALGEEITLTKRDVHGNLLWEASYDQTDKTKWEKATWVTTDSHDDIVVSGTLMSGYSNPVNAASIVMKFHPDGTLAWRQVYESSFDGSYTRKCLVDAADNVYVLGMGSGPSGFVTKIKKFAPDGTALWSYFDADGIGAPTNFKLTPDNALIVTGRSIFGSVNGYAKVDLSGNEVWSYPGVFSLTVGDADGDAFGNSYLVHGEYVSGGGTVIKKLDPAGMLLWENVYDLSGFRIEVGNDNRAVVSGFPNAGTPGAAFIKVNEAGQLLWSNLDADGSLALLLHAHMLLDDSNDAYLAAGTLFEMAVCKVNADGTSGWTQTMSGSYANAIALGNRDPGVFVVGGTTARLIDQSEIPWENLGQGLAGTSGVPVLAGRGNLTAGSEAELSLTDARPLAASPLVIGFSAVNLPLLGGVLVPAPDFVLTSLITNAKGGWLLGTQWPAGIPSGLELYLQTWIVDAGGPRGYAASNALRGTTP
ncbi:MAG: hypothetical protein U1E76_27025 [Planctomycetota bacterium]